MIERGPFLPREKDNWDDHGSFKYYSSVVMFNKDGDVLECGDEAEWIRRFRAGGEVGALEEILASAIAGAAMRGIPSAVFYLPSFTSPF